jgi:hypothetical protein
VRIPVEAGQGFRREVGHRSGVKASILSDAKAATCGWLPEGWPPFGRNELRVGLRRCGILVLHGEGREMSARRLSMRKVQEVLRLHGVRFEPAAGRSGVRCREGERSGPPGEGAAGRRAGSGVGELERAVPDSG